MFIYKITNLINKKVYIGKSVNAKNRFAEHKRSLRKNKHENKYLQNSWNKYGEDSFEFVIIYTFNSTNNEEISSLEKHFIKEHRANIKKFGYNLTLGGEGCIGRKVSKTTKKKLSKAHLSRHKQYNLKECKVDALRFNTRLEWQKGSRKLYRTAVKKGWIDKCCSHMIKTQKPRGYWTFENCKQEALRYKTKSNWRKKHPASYSAAYRGKWLTQCCSHMVENNKPKNYWTLELCKKQALKYESRKIWSTKDKSSYAAAWKNSWVDDCCNHMITLNWTLDMCKTDSLKYKTRQEWATSSDIAYQTAYRNKWLDICCAHMQNKKLDKTLKPK